MESEKKRDVKFIVGMVVLTAVMAVMGAAFWRTAALQARKDMQEEKRLEAEAVRAICVEAGSLLKEKVFVDMNTKHVFRAQIPREGIYNRRDVLIPGDVLENGDMVKIYGDGMMTRSVPADYPGVTKMKRIGRASLQEAQPYQEIAEDVLGGEE